MAKGLNHFEGGRVEKRSPHITNNLAVVRALFLACKYPPCNSHGRTKGPGRGFHEAAGNKTERLKRGKKYCGDCNRKLPRLRKHGKKNQRHPEPEGIWILMVAIL